MRTRIENAKPAGYDPGHNHPNTGYATEARGRGRDCGPHGPQIPHLIHSKVSSGGEGRAPATRGRVHDGPTVARRPPRTRREARPVDPFGRPPPRKESPREANARSRRPRKGARSELYVPQETSRRHGRAQGPPLFSGAAELPPSPTRTAVQPRTRTAAPSGSRT